MADETPLIFDPEQFGARCGECYLRHKRAGDPVPDELNAGAKVLVVGEAPGETEVEMGRPFCLAGETLVLMADLSWRPLADVQIGDRILTLEEEPSRGAGASGRVARRWLFATVTAKYAFQRETVEMITDRGNLVGTPDHRLLSRLNKCNGAWRPMGTLTPFKRRDAQLRSVAHVGAPWQANRDYETGWLAGFLDGEGHVLGSRTVKEKKRKKSRRQGRVGFSQNVGPVLERAEAAVARLGFALTAKEESRYKGVTIARRHIGGGFLDSMRFLGTVRPTRLLRDFAAVVERFPPSNRGVGDALIGELRPAGTRTVYDITTTAGTFIANGFVAHNCGQSGAEAMKAFTSIGVQRPQVSWANAVSCRPPGNDMRRLLHDLDKLNKKRVAEGKPALPTPAECCRPRFLNVLRLYHQAIAFGQHGLAALVHNDEVSILRERGGPIRGVVTPAGAFEYEDVFNADTGHRVDIMPTLHPAFVMRARRWTRPFRADVAKAMRLFNGTLSWANPTVEFDPSPARLEAFLRRDAPFNVLDYETDGLESLTCNVRCLGIGDEKHVVMVRFLSIDGHTRYHDTADEERLKQVLAEYLRDRTRLKAGHNFAVYDRLVARRQLGVDPVPVLDSLALHKSVESELPHGLGFVASIYTDVNAWKAKNTAKHAKSDSELHAYCLMRGTPVVLADGSTRTIDRLVRERYAGAVRGRGPDGRLGEFRVTGWYKTSAPGQQWTRITTAATRPGQRGLVVTPDHRVLTRERGWVEAAGVRRGEHLLRDEGTLAQAQLDMIAGTLLGDSLLVTSPTLRDEVRPRALGVQGGHVAASNLAQMKVAVLGGPAQLGRVDPARRVIVGGRAGIARAFQHWAVAQSHQLGEIAPAWRLYDAKRRRRLSADLVATLSPAGLAWWFMDDGFRQNGQRSPAKHPGERGGRLHGRDSCGIATQRYPRYDVVAAGEALMQRFGGRAWVGADGVLRFSVELAENFCRAIAPWVFPKQRHKLVRTATLPRFDAQLYRQAAAQRPEGLWVRVASVGAFKPKRKTHDQRATADTRYCIDVDRAHNFFTTTGLVHNCAVDVATDAAVIPQLQQAVEVRGQTAVAIADHKAMRIAADMHENGMFVNEPARAEWDAKLRAEAIFYKAKLCNLASNPEHNPNSTKQVGDLLFERWGLNVVEYTELGEPSTSDSSIRALLVAKDTPANAKDYLYNLRMFRKRIKSRGTYIRKMVPNSQVIYPDDLSEDDDWEEAIRRERAEQSWRRKHTGKQRHGILLSDRRIHGDWSITPVSGRYASSNPNCFDVETEVLTKHGWTPLPQLRLDDDVMQWRSGAIPGSDVFEFVRPTQLVRETYTGAMVQLRHAFGLDLNVTADHRTPLWNHGALRMVERLAGDFVRQHRGAWLGGLDQLIVMGADPRYGGSGWKVRRVAANDVQVTTSQVTDLPVYCLSVPSSYVVVKRHGYTAITGQCQNYPRRLRNCIMAAPGNILVAADMDQIELRLASALAGATNYLEAFAAPKGAPIHKRDPHTMAALMMQGDKGWALLNKAIATYGDAKAKNDPDWSRLRDFAKRFQYANLYGAELPTVHDTLTSTENDQDELIYANLDLRETRRAREAWLAANPEFVRWWENEVLLFRRNNFLRDVVIGRQRDFLDGEDRNEILNFRAQASASAIVNMAMFELCLGDDAPLRMGRWGPNTGLINHGHDALMFEVPESKGPWAAGIIVEAMTRRVPGLDVLFTAEAKQGYLWSKV